MLSRALTLAATRSGCGSVGGAARWTRLPTLAAASTPPTVHHVRVAHRSISSSPPLQSSPGGDEGDTEGVERAPDEKMAMIKRWMKWNTSKTWRYTPNHDLIAQIGKEGTKSPLDEFRDLVPREKREAETVGRSWSARELRRKSYDDLHKLWYVLYKEKNMILTEANLARRHGYEMVQPERRKKVRKSMGAIKQVLGERKRKKLADHRAYLDELERFDKAMAEMNLGGEEDGIEEAMGEEAEQLNSNEKL